MKEYMNKCKPENFKESPREAWQMIFKLRDSFQTHHREYGGQCFKNQKGKLLMTKVRMQNILKNTPGQSLTESYNTR